MELSFLCAYSVVSTEEREVHEMAAFRNLTNWMRNTSTWNQGLDFMTRIASVRREREL